MASYCERSHVLVKILDIGQSGVFMRVTFEHEGFTMELLMNPSEEIETNIRKYLDNFFKILEIKSKYKDKQLVI